MELYCSLENTQIEKIDHLCVTGKKLKTNYEIPPTPPPSLDDEVMLMTNRLFILPLIEANESSEIFETPDA